MHFSILLFALAAALVSAQDAELRGNLPALPIGSNDLIAVTVYGAPELTRTIRVGAEGWIRLPMLKQAIQAQGRMPAELEIILARALEREEILVEPVVTVTVAEYHSRPISVAGAVRHPTTFQASGKTTLLEALTRAEGLSEDAGNEVLVTRPAVNGQPPLVQRISVKGLIDGADPALNVLLEGGEELRVPRIGRVFVVGNVKRPGAVRIDDGSPMTVLKALAMAEGLTPYSTKLAYVYHRGDGQAAEKPIELRKIMDRKAPDLPLEANDIFYIPDNRTRRTTMTAVEKAIGFATATTSGILILGVR